MRDSAFVDPLQQGFNANLFGNAQDVQLGGQPGLNQFADQGLGRLFGQGQAGNNALFAGAQQNQNDPFQQQQLDTLGNFSNGQALEGQISNLSDSLGTFFNEQLLPGINQTSQLAGQGIGSGRNSVARGQATRDVGNAFTRGVADLNAQFGQQQINAATAGLSGRQDQNRLSGDLNQQGIGNLPDLANLGVGQFTAPFAALQQLAQILGPQTVLAGGGTETGAGIFGGGGGGGGILGAIGSFL